MDIVTSPFHGRGCAVNPFSLAKSFGYDDPNSKGLKDLLLRCMLHSGQNIIIEVNDCETDADWVEVTSGFTQSVGATGVKIGTNCLKLVSDGNQTGVYKTSIINESAAIPKTYGSEVQEMDWTDCDYLGLWTNAQNADHFGTAGELQVSIDNNGTVQTYKNVIGNQGTAHKFCEIDITAWSRDKVRALYFKDNNTNASENDYIDQIIRYKFGTGKGPVMGNCISLPITSGQTLTRGNIAKIVAGAVHRIQAASAAAIDCLGPVVIGGTGTAGGTVWATIQTGGFCYLEASAATVAGEGIEWAAAHQIAGVATGVDEFAFGRCFEAAGEQYDHILCQILANGVFIS